MGWLFRHQWLGVFNSRVLQALQDQIIILDITTQLEVGLLLRVEAALQAALTLEDIMAVTLANMVEDMLLLAVIPDIQEGIMILLQALITEVMHREDITIQAELQAAHTPVELTEARTLVELTLEVLMAEVILADTADQMVA